MGENEFAPQSLFCENLEMTQASVSFKPLTLASAGANALVLRSKATNLKCFLYWHRIKQQTECNVSFHFLSVSCCYIFSQTVCQNRCLFIVNRL